MRTMAFVIFASQYRSFYSEIDTHSTTTSNTLWTQHVPVPPSGDSAETVFIVLCALENRPRPRYDNDNDNTSTRPSHREQ